MHPDNSDSGVMPKVKKKLKSRKWKFHFNKKQTSSDDNKLSFSLEVFSNLKEGTESENGFDLYIDTDCDEMPKVLDDMEEEIERQLEEKAQKSNLTVANVKNMLKAVITNRGVMDMVNYSLQRSSEKPSFEPKLTRAKRKELMEKESAVWQIPLVKKKSDFVALIGQDLPEDSSDEEYNPQEDLSDEESKANESLSPDQDDLFADGKKECSKKEGNAVEKIDENIGQRTRSKLCLSETPLETIEQAFVPPDITTDMYNTECDNQDWATFLQEFMQPLDTNLNETVDDENDPEYNVMVDEEHESPDIEELRVDRAVKITKKELNDLMSELFEFTNNMISSDEEDSSKKTNNSPTGKLESEVRKESNSPISKTPNRVSVKREQENKPMMKPEVFSSNFTTLQFSLFQQQLRQHIQLLTQSFLMSRGNPYLGENYSRASRDKLVELYYLGINNPYSAFNACNLLEGIKLVNKWENLISDSEFSEKMTRFMEKEVSDIQSSQRKRTDLPRLSEQVMEVCSESKTFIYPLLLPKYSFRPSCKLFAGFSSSELQLLALGLEQFSNYFQEYSECDEVTVSDVAHLISTLMMPTRSSASIVKQIKKLRKGINNPVKYFFDKRRAPEVYHYIIPVDIENQQPLRECPYNLLPSNWAEFFKRQKLADI